EFETVDEDVVVEWIALRGKGIVAGAGAANDVPILPMIGGVGDEQAALRMDDDGRQVVEEIVRMGEDDGADPLFTVVVSCIVDPDRAEGGMERAFATAREEPDASVAVADDAGKIVVGVGAGLCLGACSAGGHFRFGTIDG